LLSTAEHPKLGRPVVLRPDRRTDTIGQLSGALQENYGLLVGPEAGELYQLPKLSTNTNGSDANRFHENWTTGATSSETLRSADWEDAAAQERARMKVVAKDSDSREDN